MTPLEFPAQLVGCASEYAYGNVVIFRSANGDEFRAPCTNNDLRRVYEMLGKDVKVKIVVEEA